MSDKEWDEWGDWRRDAPQMSRKEQQAWDNYDKEQQWARDYGANWREEDAEYYKNPPPHPHKGLPSYQGNRNLIQFIALLVLIFSGVLLLGSMCLHTAGHSSVILDSGTLFCLIGGVFLFGLGLLAFIPDGITR